MAKELSVLPDFNGIKDHIETERKSIIKINNFSEEDGYVRSTSDALLILSFLTETITPLWNLFNEHPTLMKFFSDDYT
ncbi:hypothetical protein, partial [Bacteriovorax sp. DB6_IX]|uniref:hypothetical protein n=1 Tax=Bacteriovorax sp. DB6_IX TaxID=1353530 RepID=UPI00054E18B8